MQDLVLENSLKRWFATVSFFGLKKDLVSNASKTTSELFFGFFLLLYCSRDNMKSEIEKLKILKMKV